MIPYSKLLRLCFLASLFITTISFSQTSTEITSTGSGTFEIPCGVTSITIEAWGAGGAGGGSNNNNAGGGAGGGSGAYAKGTYSVTAGQIISYYVGSGGTGNYNQNGSDGEATTISTFSITAGGGYGGQKNQSGSAGSGGIASGGNVSNTNGYTGSQGTSSTGGNGANAPYGGYGGNGNYNDDGDNGSSPGGGGGGGEGYYNYSQSGGNGGNGQITFTYASAAASSYCTPSFDHARAITNVTFASINNNSSSGWNIDEYESFCDEASVTSGQSYSISVTSGANENSNYYVTVYIDWDQDSSFEESERYNIGHVWYSGTVNGTISVPSSASSGTTYMRVILKEDSYIGNACGNYHNKDGQTEDYIVNISSLPCTTPTAQPTNLSLNTSDSTVDGSFTASSSADSYLVMYSTSSMAPTLQNTTTYNEGGTYNGYTVVSNDNDTSFTTATLSTNQTYYFYVYSYNQGCVGGPLYLTNNPLIGDSTTSVSYCTPTTNNTSSDYISQINFIGTLNDTSNSSTYSASGYEDYTSLTAQSIQAQGESINIFVELSGLTAVYAWVDWNLDGDFNDSGENVYSTGGTSIYSTTFGFVVPSSATPGDYTFRIRTANNNSCNNSNSGETEDYTFSVITNCEATITSITEGENCGEGEITLEVTGSSGTTEFRWYDTETGGTLLGTTSTGTWTTPNITTSTSYYATAYNGSCESLERTELNATIKPVPSLSVSPENPVVCGEDAVIELEADGETEEIYLIDEDFETGSFNTFSYQDIGTSTAGSEWEIEASPYIPDEEVWFPAIASGFNGNYFAMVNSDLGSNTTVNNAIVSSSVNSTDFISLNLSFDIYYSNYSTSTSSDLVKVEVSTNGGANWSDIQTYNEDLGVGSNFTTISLNMSSYLDYNNLKIRFRYIAGWNDGMAIDNIKLYGDKPLSTAFTWSGATVDAYLDAACTIPYVEGTDTSSTVYIKPTLSQLEQETYTFTLSAVLSNSCIASKDVTVTNKTKVWQGNSTFWVDSNNWLPLGEPTEENCVIIKDIINSNLPANITGNAKNFKVKNGSTFKIKEGATLTIQEEVSVEDNGLFIIENNGSLIQVEDVTNTGTISMIRNTEISKYDYAYWSSPVANFSVKDVSPDTPVSLIWKWVPTVNNEFGTWVNTAETMVTGKGYSIRAPMYYPVSTDTLYTANFIGTPNNGTITKSIQRGDYVGNSFLNVLNGVLVTTYDDNWNLIGNPYPSAIKARSFMVANTNIEGAIHIWTHGTNPNQTTVNPFYNSYNSNYTAADYVTYNATGTATGANIFGGYIGAGQGFFIKMEDGSADTQDVVFTNAMRNSTYTNNEFYKIINSEHTLENVTDVIQEGRMWIDFASPNKTTRILIGYVDGATNGKDRLFDAYTDEEDTQNFYSILTEGNLLIQGKAVPFLNTDTVPLGFLAATSGSYTIAINEVDGLFADGTQSEIYLEDTYLNIIHDLHNTPYSFTVSQAGRYDDRFILRYTDASAPMSSENFENSNTIKVVSISEQIKVVSDNQPITHITTFDNSGRRLLDVDGDYNTTVQFSLKKNTTSLLLKITTSDGATTTRKIIH
ncbi:hypothetical protein NBRC110019_18480 [Neptunitalea chrysea]|uniref:Ig-like domain-containing protein n=1 Tax=Neptunitalea chrysea TaxID=1647581 RepID=A0A9W6EWD9_9FLAO|nr:GEVED domain-containing protein [Neptunitalea chrysea]GLB52808.1 hypothetical protein NBRC110019_18480 [Neptunitalea chrysea]